MTINDNELKILENGFKDNKLHDAARIVMNGKACIGWTTNYHTAVPVLTTSQGVKAEMFTGFIENTDISNRLKTIL